MNDTTHRPEAARRLTGCPWPTGIHRFVLGVCSRCGTDDLNPVANRGGFTDADDQPIPFVPTPEATMADAMVTLFDRPLDLAVLDPNREARIVAQVAVEAIVDHPHDGWEPETMRLVLDHAIANNVAPLYVGMLQDLVDAL